MHLPSTIVSVLLVSGLGVHAGAPSDLELGLGHVYRRQKRSASIEEHMHGEASRQLSRLHRRQAPPSPEASATAPSTPVLASNGTDLDPQTWDAETAAACERVVRELNGQVLSQSGIAVCYNLPSFDNSTGAFEADLRLYRVAPAQGAWSGVSDQDVTIGLAYTGAVVSDNRRARTREVRPASVLKRQDAGPSLLWSSNVVGRLNTSFASTPMNLTQLVSLLAPNVTLSARNAEQQDISTTLTSKEASFVNGVFAGSPVGAASARLARPTPFVMPGLGLGKFPVSLVVSSVWAVLGVAVMTWGTVGRYQYRQQYRRRKMRERLTAAKR